MQFFAGRSRSHRARFVYAHLASLLFLSYGRLTCFNRLCSRCLSAWRSAFPSTSDHSLCSLRSAFLSTVCFPFAPHKLFQTSPHNAYPRALEFGGTFVCPPKKKKKRTSLPSSVIHFASVELVHTFSYVYFIPRAPPVGFSIKPLNFIASCMLYESDHCSLFAPLPACTQYK